MRVLTLTNCYPPHYYGGYELTCRDVMERFVDAGHEVAVLTSDSRVPGVSDLPEVNVHRELRAYWDWNRNIPVIPRSPRLRWRIEAHNHRALRFLLERMQPHVVSAWHMLGISLTLLTAVERHEIPLVVTVANEWLVEGVRYDGWSRMFDRRPLLRGPDILGVPTNLPTLRRAELNFVSEHTKRQSSASPVWRVNPSAPVIRPGIDTTDFPIRPRPAKAWTGRLLYVGRVDRNKGVATLLRAFALLADTWTLDILGSSNDDYGVYIRRLGMDLGVDDRVTFGRVPRHELRPAYVESDVVIFPSEWDEPFGLVPLEAMASGVPVVATRTGGAAEFLLDGANCLAFPAGDSPALAAAIERLAENPSLRRRLVKGGFETVRSLTAERYTDELSRLHLQAAGY